MENSNTLQKIEDVSHTVIIDDTFCAYSFSFYDKHKSIDNFVRAIEKGLGIDAFNKELVYSRINKPTKERVYTEQEVRSLLKIHREFYEQYFIEAKHIHSEVLELEKEIIESLNK